MATQTDYRAIFALYLEVIDAQGLTDAQKLKMLKNSIEKTLGEKAAEKGDK